MYILKSRYLSNEMQSVCRWRESNLLPDEIIRKTIFSIVIEQLSSAAVGAPRSVYES